MNRPSLFARLLEPKAARGHWLTAGIVLAGALVCEIAARVSTIRPNGQALSNFFQRGDAGPVLRLYDRLAGDGMSRGTVAALGFMPYVSARMFTWLARSVSPTLDTRWSSQDGRVERKRWTVGLTFTLALIQSYGLARFTQALPGAVGQSGAETRRRDRGRSDGGRNIHDVGRRAGRGSDRRGRTCVRCPQPFGKSWHLQRGRERFRAHVRAARAHAVTESRRSRIA